MTRELKIGSKSYLLRLTNSGARLAQELTKKPFLQVVTDFRQMDLEVVRVLLYAALRPEHAALTLPDVDALMDSEDFNLVHTVRALKDALGDYMDPSKTVPVETKKKVRGSRPKAS